MTESNTSTADALNKLGESIYSNVPSGGTFAPGRGARYYPPPAAEPPPDPLADPKLAAAVERYFAIREVARASTAAYRDLLDRATRAGDGLTRARSRLDQQVRDYHAIQQEVPPIQKRRLDRDVAQLEAERARLLRERDGTAARQRSASELAERCRRYLLDDHGLTDDDLGTPGSAFVERRSGAGGSR